jgi:hypothetical protein
MSRRLWSKVGRQATAARGPATLDVTAAICDTWPANTILVVDLIQAQPFSKPLFSLAF